MSMADLVQLSRHFQSLLPNLAGPAAGEERIWGTGLNHVYTELLSNILTPKCGFTVM